MAAAFQKLIRRTCIGVVALGLGSAGLASAQTPGDRVRVTMRAGETPLAGSFVRASADSVWIALPGRGDPVPVVLGPGVRYERSLGRRSHALTGALVGAGVGAGLTLWFLNGFCDDPDTLCDGDEQLFAAAVFGLPSLAVGLGVGALIKSERWTPVVRAASGSGAGLRLGVAVRW